jgi:hypothetical protein
MAEISIVAGKEAERYYPYSSMFYANRHSFWLAGQNSWVLPPSQDQDSFLQLTNVEPVLQGVLQRRRGYQVFGAYSGSSAPAFTHSYAFRNDAIGLRRVVWCCPVKGPMATDEQGNIILNPVYTPVGLNTPSPRMVLSRDYAYFSDTTGNNSVKWDGTTSSNAVTNWGTSVGNVPVSTFGPLPPGTVADVPLGGPEAAFPWSPTTSLPTSVTITTGSVAHSDYLELTNFGFNVPPASAVGPITGIQVTITGFSPDVLVNPESISVNLLKGGAIVGSGHWWVPPGTSGPTVLGGGGDLWGTTFTNVDINDPTFGVSIVAYALFSNSPYTLNVSNVTVEVLAAGGSIAFTTNTTTTNVVLLNGRTYTYAFQNSTTLTTSDLGPFSVSTGPLTGNQINLTNIPVSSDPQITTVLILATADGNDETTLYLLGTVPNGTTTFTDNIPDELSALYTNGPTLLTNELYQDTDAFGNLHGVANNAPPPAGLNYMVKHKGRLYGAVGRTLYFSKNLDDVTTANGLITCKWEEAWPSINQFDISELAETVQGLLSDGETLWIGTESNIRRLIGDSPSNFQIPEIQFNDVGLLGQDTWKIVFSEGAPVGTMWLTKDFKVMASDFNTYADVGRPIQDILNQVNTLGVFHAAFVAKGPANYFMLYLPVNAPDGMPNTACVFDLVAKKWFVWKPSDEVSTSLFFIDASGAPRWLFAGATPNITTQSYFYEWIQGSFQDRINLAPTTYAVTIQTTWLDMGDYGLRKFVNQIIPTTGDNSALTIMVEAASNEQDFNAPLLVVGPTVVTPAAIPDDVFVPLASGPSHSRAFRFTFTSPPSTVQNVLTGFSIEAGVFHRY